MNTAKSPTGAILTEKPGIAIVGTGAVGSALGLALSEHYPIRAILSRHIDRAHRLASTVGATYAISIVDPLPIDVRIVFLCVPDDAITQTAAKLAESTDWQGIIAAHTSGAKAASALQPLAEKGASIMSFHPVQTFVKDVKASFSDIYIGLEGDAEAVEAGIQISEQLGAKHVVIDTENKPVYHLAASIASNYLVTLMSNACDALESIGLKRTEAVALLKPLVMQTCTNVTSSLPEQALSGPAARGDQQTLDMHIKAIQAHLPQMEDFYRTLLASTLEVARKGSRLTTQDIEEIKQNL